MKKRNIIISCIAFLTSILAMVPVGAAVAKVVAERYTEDKESGFVYTDTNGYMYNVYPLTVDGVVGVYPVSIAWGGDPNDTPANFTIPSVFTSESGTVCTVYALSTSSFAYCDFETVVIPETVREMKQQSFLGCQNLRTITIPKYVTEIEESCFMDCRKLQTVKYTNDADEVGGSDCSITVIDDHAFASCVSLVSFTFPDNLVRIGRSAFEGCLKLTKALLPKDTPLVIEEYAFANCPRMNIVHVPTTVSDIKPFAFADCVRLTIYFQATTITGVNGPDTIYSEGNKKYRKLRTATADGSLVPYVLDYSAMSVDNYHPDFIFTVTEAFISVTGTGGFTKETDLPVLQKKMKFATIIGYAGDGTASEDFELGVPDAKTGKDLDTLTIPEYLADSADPTATAYPVSVIGKDALSGHAEIQKVVFNSNLVKIEEAAFNRCTSLEVVDFDACVSLAEIGKYCFQAETGDDVSILSSVDLPASLKIIDGYAFANLAYLEHVGFRTQGDDDASPKRENKLIAIGRYAFYKVGTSAVHKNSDHVILPNSLSDTKCNEFFRKWKLTGTGGANINNDRNGEAYPIAAYAFQDSRFIDILEMEEDNCGDSTHMTCNWISFGNSAVKNANLNVFISSHNLYRLHVNSFTNNHKMKTAILYADKAYRPDRTTDWYGTNISPTASFSGDARYPLQVGFKHGIFGGCDNVAVYINLSETELAPRLSTQIFHWDQVNTAGNSNSGMSNSCYTEQTGDDYKTSTTLYSNRISVPVHYNVDLEEFKTHYSENFSYYRSSEGGNHTVLSNYIGTASSVDLASFSSQCSSAGYPLTVIGAYAFANNKYGRSINTITNLPTTLKKISEGAFFSISTANTKAEAGYQSYSRITTGTTASLNGNTAFCLLPSNVEYIGDRAFINHRFKSIQLTNASGLTYLGLACFQVSPDMYITPMSESLITDFTFEDNSTFFMEDDNIYYRKDNGDLVLIQNVQKANRSGHTVTVKAGTIALSAESMLGLKADKLTVNSEMTTMYGFALSGSAITEINGDLSNIKYLGGRAKGSDVEAFVTDSHASNTVSKIANANYDNRAYSFGPFRGCMKLATMNMSQMTNLVSLGKEAFIKDSKLVNMTGGVSYTYQQYNASSNTVSNLATVTNTVCDLSGAHGLRYLGEASLKAVSLMKYFHLPNTTTSKTQESNLTLEKDVIAGTSGVKVLVGECAKQAYFSQSGLNSEKHYLSNSLNAGTVYYHATEASDIVDGDVKYWIEGSAPNTYILINSRSDAQSFFANYTA